MFARIADGQVGSVRVRITTRPHEQEVDGIRLESFEPGMTRDVSATLGTWLIAAGYAEHEMRLAPRAPTVLPTDGPQEP